jgi:hypothetical protein
VGGAEGGVGWGVFLSVADGCVAGLGSWAGLLQQILLPPVQLMCAGSPPAA